MELVVMRLPGLIQVLLRGPVTGAATINCPANGRWLAIRFRLGVFFPSLPTVLLVDRNDVNFPTLDDGRFWLGGALWEIPTFQNAELFVFKLAKQGIITLEPAVSAAMYGDRQVQSRRSVQRHFLRATGVTHAQLRQIERARYATHLLREGESILDVVHAAGYFDQAHLTRSLKSLIGQTPVTILKREAQLSFLYKTALPA